MAPKSVESLFKPCSLGPLTLRNRIFMGSLTRNRCINNLPSDIHVEHYSQRVKGGAGLIVSEGLLIEPQGAAWQYAAGIWSEEQIAAWKKVNDVVHAEGGVIFGQLWHLGRASHPDAPLQIASGKPVYAPSAVKAIAPAKFRFLPGEPGYQEPTAIEDPKDLVEQFRLAAVNAKLAGFDGVKVQAGSGYLVSQFLSSRANKRTDEYGGSVKNRTRFGLEVLRALKEVWGPGRVAFKINPSAGVNDVVMPLNETIETYSHFFTEADELELAYVQLVVHYERDGSVQGMTDSIPHDVVRTYRPFLQKTPIFINGKVDPVEAAGLVDEGLIQGAVICRPWISMPDLVKRLEHGLPLDVPYDRTTYYAPPSGDSGSATVEELVKGYNNYPLMVMT